MHTYAYATTFTISFTILLCLVAYVTLHTSPVHHIVLFCCFFFGILLSTFTVFPLTCYPFFQCVGQFKVNPMLLQPVLFYLPYRFFFWILHHLLRALYKYTFDAVSRLFMFSHPSLSCLANLQHLWYTYLNAALTFTTRGHDSAAKGSLPCGFGEFMSMFNCTRLQHFFHPSMSHQRPSVALCMVV